MKKKINKEEYNNAICRKHIISKYQTSGVEATRFFLASAYHMPCFQLYATLF